MDHRERQEALIIQLVATINKQDDPAKILYFKSKEKVLNQSMIFFLNESTVDLKYYISFRYTA